MVRKTQKLRPVMVRLPETLRRQLAELADSNARSMNTEIIYRLEQALTEDRAKEPPKASLAERLDKIEKTLESYASVLKAQQKVAQDALAALARESKKTDKGEEQ
jgi:hypothetical protein